MEIDRTSNFSDKSQKVAHAEKKTRRTSAEVYRAQLTLIEKLPPLRTQCSSRSARLSPIFYGSPIPAMYTYIYISIKSDYSFLAHKSSAKTKKSVRLSLSRAAAVNLTQLTLISSSTKEKHTASLSLSRELKNLERFRTKLSARAKTRRERNELCGSVALCQRRRRCTRVPRLLMDADNKGKN